MRDKVIHSSLKPVLRLQRDIDSNLGGFPSSLGVIIQKGGCGYLLSFHEPKLSSIIHGVVVPFEDKPADDLKTDLDRRTREALLSMSQACKTLAADLLQHVTRLKEVAKEEQLIWDSCPGVEPENLATDSFLSSGNNHAKVTEIPRASHISSSKPDPFD